MSQEQYEQDVVEIPAELWRRIKFLINGVAIRGSLRHDNPSTQKEVNKLDKIIYERKI